VVSIADFFETVVEDPRILASHIVLYLGLINIWQNKGCPDEFEIVAAEVMKSVKLTRDTFRIRINDLKDFGYIRYEAAGNQYVKGVVGFKKL
jgi:hypothetical protein